MQIIWERFPSIVQVVKEKHEEVKLYGAHDINHALRAGQLAQEIALDEWRDLRLSELAGVGGICHNADRILQRELNIGRAEVPKEKIIDLVRQWLNKAEFDLTPSEKEMIVEVISRHDRKNSEGPSSITVERIEIAVTDGDKVVNLDLDLIIRSGQHYHDLPAVDFVHFLDDPKATYRNPGSSLRDIAYSLDWVDPKSSFCIRTRLGMKLGEERATTLGAFFDTLKKQLEEERIMPYPFQT